ncbi:hypothetical protein C8R47DRAFT_1252140 [Mycena vitilis]|nr:hypothetical protein C8R47DRAFT_1252140 [Mycena vitilis]
MSSFLTIWSVVIGQFFFPMKIQPSQVFNVVAMPFHRSHVSHMRMDRLRRCPSYRDPSLIPYPFSRFVSILRPSFSVLGAIASRFLAPLLPLPGRLFGFGRSWSGSNNHHRTIYVAQIRLSGRLFDFLHRLYRSDNQYWSIYVAQIRLSGCVFDFLNSWYHSGSNRSTNYVAHAPVVRLRGGASSDGETSDEDDFAVESDAPGPSGKRKLKPKPSNPRKSAKMKGKARAVEVEADRGIQVTLGRGKASGIYVDELIYIGTAPETWEPSDHRKTLTVDAMVKKQDSWTGPTGSRNPKHLAEVVVLDDGIAIDCRRSNLSCGAFFTCSMAASDYLEGFERSEDDSEDLVSAPVRAAKSAEAGSLIAIATEFYQSVNSKYCTAQAANETFPCGGHAVMRKFTHLLMANYHLSVAPTGQANDDVKHRFTKIPHSVRESILRNIFRGEPIEVDDDDVVVGPCQQICHPAHLPNNKLCPRTHFRDGRNVRGTLSRRGCLAKLTIFIPIDVLDLRAVVIPSKCRHSHPIFPRVKVPFAAADQYRQCIKSTGPIGLTTLRVDKSSTTRAILGGKLPQEVHPSLINNRKRRELVSAEKMKKFPHGTGLAGVWNEFELDKARAPEDRYIHAVNTLVDDTHVIVSLNPELAALTLEASWIMVDTTFAVVHGKTNEWKLLIWLNGLDKRTVIGRVWSNRATREAFVLVWNGIFQAIESITGTALNFKVFSKTSCLLGALGDSEGAQAQALGDVIILRRLNLKEVNGTASVEVDVILMFIWKTCIVHFNRGVFALESYIEETIFEYLLSFPYLETDEDIREYYSFCNSSPNKKLKAWWTHKLSYPWLLPSLNRQLSKMDNKFWDLTPRDTNPIEGSHAQDNQVNKTNSTLLEALLLARQFDCDNARVIKASIEFGVWENGNNSIRARFTSQAARQSRAHNKKAVAAMSEKGTKKLKDQLKVAERRAQEQEQEIQRLQTQLGLEPTPSTPQAGPSRILRTPSTPEQYIDVDHRTPSRPLRMKALDIFSGLRPMTPIAEPRSDFDYAGALNSDILDSTLQRIQDAHPMYPVNGDEEILASDPYPVPR